MWDKIADQPLKFSGQVGTFFFTFLEKNLSICSFKYKCVG